MIQISRGQLLGAALLTACAIAAAPAQARLLPAGSIVSGSSTDSQISNGAFTIRCPRADATGNVNATATGFSLRLAFAGDRVRTCETRFIVSLSATVSCSGLVTLRETGSLSGTAYGTVAFDTGFSCTIDIPGAGCRITIRGPQSGNIGWVFSQSTQVLNLSAFTVVADGSGGPCGGAGQTVVFYGRTYAITPRITVS